MDDLKTKEAIKSVPGFIASSQAKSLADHIDFLENTQFDAFNIYQDGKRASLQFGHDLHYGLDPEYKFFLNLDLLGDESTQNLVKAYCNNIINQTKLLFSEEDELYVSALWLAKQYPGATIPAHDDTDGGYNLQYVYSAILYLNDSTTGGELSFIDLEYSYSPNCGDLVVFPSQGTGDHTVKEVVEDRYSLVLWLTKDKTLALIAPEVDK